MKLANTTGDFYKYNLTYLEKIKALHEAGFKYIDLSLYVVEENDPLLIADDWQKTALEIQEYADANGIQFVQSHSPNCNPLKNGKLEESVKLNIRAIEVCGALGISNLVVHPGWYEDNAKEDWFKLNKQFYSQLFDAMEKNNVNVLHENTTSVNLPWFTPKTGAEMREFSEYVNHPKFHSCWDTGHANIEGSQYDEIMAMGDDLYAVHFNDNRGTCDEHIAPFLGTMNSDEIMHALIDVGFKGPLTFECDNSLRPADFWLGNRRGFAEDTRLRIPPLELQKEFEKFMYSVGKCILTAYGMFEG